jgi:two-component system phosphate regulon sensor histidine kinase PhoR
MTHDWRTNLLRHLVLLAAASLLLGALSGAYAWSLTLAMALYLGWTLYRLWQMQHWLKTHQDQEEPPQSEGLFGEIYDSLYHRQRRSRRSRERLQEVIERVQASTAALREAVVMLDQDGNLEWWNPAAESLLGLKLPDRGQPVTNLIRHPRFKDYFGQPSRPEPLELTSPLNDDLRLQFQLTEYGEQEYLMVVRDVSRLHQLEQMRKDFVANVSHELRTPLTVISGYLETLLEQPDGIEPRWRRALQQMQQQGGRMQRLVDDLLLLARLEASDYPSDSSPVEVPQLLAEIVDQASLLSGERGQRISLEAEPDLRIKGSDSELHSAFANLVVNAVNYTQPGAEIRVRWWSDAEGAHLSVTDNGPGIEERHLARLTERFYRVDSGRSSAAGGTGLGLAIVKHVLLRHRARLTIDSHPGQGSTFCCHFPCALVVRHN